MALAVACALFLHSNFSMHDSMCVLTVYVVIFRVSAISLAVKPLAESLSICNSRFVKRNLRGAISNFRVDGVAVILYRSLASQESCLTASASMLISTGGCAEY